MAYDGVMMQAVTADLQQRLEGARVQKIYQPMPLRLTLDLYAGSALQLLVVVEPQQARLHLSEQRHTNPQQAPTFCMVLRKHLEGGRVVAVEQDRLERILILTVLKRLGDATAARRLLVEIMGRHSNVMLLDERDTIIDAMKRIPVSKSRYRQILPGHAYDPPPDQGKTDPRQWQRTAWEEAAAQAVADGIPVWRLFFNHLMGIGPQTARELAVRSELDPEKVLDAADGAAAWQGVRWLSQTLETADFAPGAFTDNDGTVQAFAPFELQHLSAQAGVDWQASPSVHTLLDAVFGEAEQVRRLRARQQRLLAAVADRSGYLEKRVEGQRAALLRAEEREELQRYGELLKTCLHQLQAGQASVTVTDWYDEAQTQVTIPLNPRLSPAENVQEYFRRYQKLERTHKEALAQLARLEPQLALLEHLHYHLEAVELDAPDAAELLQQLERELAAAGVLERASRSGARQTRRASPRFRRGVSSQGIPILVGRTSQENHMLTFDEAQPEDFWLHVKERPGSHVVLRLAASDAHRGSSWDEVLPSLEEAAQLAAYFSSARQGSNVPVDAARCRQVRRQPGGGPGQVTYQGHRTLYPTPDAATVRRVLDRAGETPAAD